MDDRKRRVAEKLLIDARKAADDATCEDRFNYANALAVVFAIRDLPKPLGIATGEAYSYLVPIVGGKPSTELDRLSARRTFNSVMKGLERIINQTDDLTDA